MRLFLVLPACCAIFIALAFQDPARNIADGPEFTASGQLEFPKDYREWVFLSAGLGMTYGPRAPADAAQNPPFSNVFVNPGAYRSFLASGNWPDGTIFMLEVRASRSEGSINRGGHFQTDLLDREVHVKDEKRFPGKWAFFAFGNDTKPAKQIPTSAACYSCHEQHGAVDTTFVQFYPTLLRAAEEKHTLRPE